MTLAPLPATTLHLVIDLQRLFAEPTVWHAPSIEAILPNVARLCDRSGQNTVFARFIPPATGAAAPGQWQQYYRRWPSVTGDHLPADMLDLVAPLQGRPGRTVDKTTYSLFGVPGFAESLQGVTTTVITGCETDVCVLATVLGAVDLGLRVVIAVDAVTSADLAAHRAVLDILAPRLSDQISLAPTAAILAAWRP